VKISYDCSIDCESLTLLFENSGFSDDFSDDFWDEAVFTGYIHTLGKESK
jgi:hypothetical protein